MSALPPTWLAPLGLARRLVPSTTTPLLLLVMLLPACSITCPAIPLLLLCRDLLVPLLVVLRPPLPATTWPLIFPASSAAAPVTPARVRVPVTAPLPVPLPVPVSVSLLPVPFPVSVPLPAALSAAVCWLPVPVIIPVSVPAAATPAAVQWLLLLLPPAAVMVAAATGAGWPVTHVCMPVGVLDVLLVALFASAAPVTAPTFPAALPCTTKVPAKQQPAGAHPSCEGSNTAGTNLPLLLLLLCCRLCCLRCSCSCSPAAVALPAIMPTAVPVRGNQDSTSWSVAGCAPVDQLANQPQPRSSPLRRV